MTYLQTVGCLGGPGVDHVEDRKMELVAYSFRHLVSLLIDFALSSTGISCLNHSASQSQNSYDIKTQNYIFLYDIPTCVSPFRL